MAHTLSDRHKIMYKKWRQQGMSHEEAMQNVPEIMRGRFVKDIKMSPIESHFGMKDKWFFISLIVSAFGTVVISIILCN